MREFQRNGKGILLKKKKKTENSLVDIKRSLVHHQVDVQNWEENKGRTLSPAVKAVRGAGVHLGTQNLKV